MSITHRRAFLISVVATGTALCAARTASAQAAKLTESDPQATALGYKEDTTKVDKAKFPNHADTQDCGNCSLFQGKAGDAAGPCILFAGKQVSAKGWCSGYNKKA